ncbi:MAG TPA: FAD-binding oxidoreductase [Kofleriaceae bacterium]|jgi:4-cresol dehydrogenase (hydroxylating)|nr:FAD-binding oxidoreductase [Kofleriaceae bacterium]
MANDNLDGFLRDVERAIGAEHVSLVEDVLRDYGAHSLPAADRRPGAVVCPGSTAEVQAVVRAANAHRVPVFPISTGHNLGLGTRAPVRAGQVVIDLGRRMNRIVELDETLGFAAVEPGVSFQMLADELERRGGRYMISTTTGPVDGSLLGNALDKGAGYGPMFDHFGMACGMEVVLGTGEVLRTGDGSLEHPTAPNWHVSKYSFGPILDGLFAQSNFGIVTRLGIWLMPRPPAIYSFHFAFPEDDDLAEIIELCRPLKLSNTVLTLFRVSNDLYLIGSEDRYPEYAQSGGVRSITDDQRVALRARHGVGAWNVSGALYGPSAEALAPQLARIQQLFLASGKARYIAHDEALAIPPFKVAIDSFSGVPNDHELGLQRWRPGGGTVWAPTGTPMIGAIAQRFQHVARAIYERHGLDYMVMNVCSGRFARGLHLITYNRELADERARADAVYRAISDAFAAEGISIARAPTDYQDYQMAKLTPAFRDTCRALKRALDPNGIIAPGRYGIE